MCEKTDFIIRQRIEQYKHDIECIKDDIYQEWDDRLTQDEVIIQELEKILTGKGLERLSYV